MGTWTSVLENDAWEFSTWILLRVFGLRVVYSAGCEY
jgi:hypothetical protein